MRSTEPLIFTVILVLLSLMSQAQDEEIDYAGQFEKKKVIVSLGYGIPSPIRIYLNQRENNKELSASGYGPMFLKIEYGLGKKWSVGINGFYGYSDVSWSQEARNPATGLQEPYRHGAEVWEAGINIRANYYFLKKNNWNAYAGLGAGRGRAEVETYTFAPKERLYIHHVFPTPWTFEGTAGAKYFMTQNIALYSEIGIGQSWFLYNYYLIPAAFAQFGMSIKL